VATSQICGFCGGPQLLPGDFRLAIGNGEKHQRSAPQRDRVGITGGNGLETIG
jgi:hypothetical protein